MKARLLAAGVAATALAGWLLYPHGPAGRRDTPAAAARHDQAGDGLAVTNERLAALEREVALRGAPREAASTADPSAPAAPARRAGAAAPRAPQRDGNEVFHGLEQRFGTEGKDTSWSAGAEASIAQAFRSESLAGSRIVRAECGTTLCRVEVSHESAATQEGFVWTVRGIPPFDHGGFAHRVDDPGSGTSRTIVYMPREGHSLSSSG